MKNSKNIIYQIKLKIYGKLFRTKKLEKLFLNGDIPNKCGGNLIWLFKILQLRFQVMVA